MTTKPKSRKAPAKRAASKGRPETSWTCFALVERHRFNLPPVFRTERGWRSRVPNGDGDDHGVPRRGLLLDTIRRPFRHQKNADDCGSSAHPMVATDRSSFIRIRTSTMRCLVAVTPSPESARRGAVPQDGLDDRLRWFLHAPSPLIAVLDAAAQAMRGRIVMKANSRLTLKSAKRASLVENLRSLRGLDKVRVR